MREYTPPPSEAENSEQGAPASGRRRSGNKRYVRNRKRRSRKNKQKDDMIKKLVQKTQKYKQKYYRLKKLINKKDNPPTPNTRVQTLLEDDKQKATIVKKLLFGEVISDQLKENYKNLKNFKEKQIFKKAITGTIIKKYRVTNKVQKICRGGKVFFKSTEASNISDYSRKRSYLKRQAQKRNAIWRFLESDLHSKMCPGKRDYCTKKKLQSRKGILMIP